MTFLARSDDGWIRREVEGVRAGCMPPYPIPAVDRACQHLQALTLEGRRAWQPSHFEFTFVEVDRPRTPSQKPWPTTLPPLPAESKRFDLLMPASESDTLTAFVDSLGPKGVAELELRDQIVDLTVFPNVTVPESDLVAQMRARVRRHLLVSLGGLVPAFLCIGILMGIAKALDPSADPPTYVGILGSRASS